MVKANLRRPPSQSVTGPSQSVTGRQTLAVKLCCDGSQLKIRPTTTLPRFVISLQHVKRDIQPGARRVLCSYPQQRPRRIFCCGWRDSTVCLCARCPVPEDESTAVHTCGTAPSTTEDVRRIQYSLAYALPGCLLTRLVLGFTKQGIASKLPPPLSQGGKGDCWMLVGTEGNSDDGHRYGSDWRDNWE